LKKIHKSQPPNKLTQYAQNHPKNDWDNDFRNDPDYKIIKELIFKEQGGLCAFCETKVIQIDKQRVEHFHPKSDAANPHHNWALDWANVIGVCLGGSDVDKSIHPLPANLSCDAYKDHLIVKKKLPIICEGHLLNPLELFAFSNLFELNKRTGELKPKADYSGIEIENNQYSTTTELVKKTIEHLNLNCDRLNQQRLAVLNEYERVIKIARNQNDRDIFSKLSKHWLQTKWRSFFTTRRILLGQHAENYLQSIHYSG
jgi:uncharacterized protein (TIGR02646 family)